MKKSFWLLPIALLFHICALAQCEIENYEIVYCDNDIEIDLAKFEPNSDGNYDYFLNGILIANPSEFQTSEEANLTVTFTENGTNCTSEFEILVSYNTAPQISIGQVPVLDCNIAVVMIPVQITPTDNILISWKGPNGFMSDEQFPIVQFPGQYNIEVTDTLNGCRALDSMDIFVDNSPPFSYVTITVNCDSTATISAMLVDTSSSVTYAWYGPSIITDQSLQNITVDSIGVYSLEVVDIDNGCVFLYQLSVSDLECPTGISNDLSENKSFSLYPNPADQFINIKADIRYDKIFIVNSLGVLIEERNINIDRIDLGDLSQGIYYVGILTSGEVYWQSFAKL